MSIPLHGNCGRAQFWRAPKQARGNKSTEGSTLTAEEVIFGTFLTRAGTVTEVDRDAGCIQVEGLTTMASLTVKQTADSRICMLPDVHTMFGKMIGRAWRGRRSPLAWPCRNRAGDRAAAAGQD